MITRNHNGVICRYIFITEKRYQEIPHDAPDYSYNISIEVAIVVREYYEALKPGSLEYQLAKDNDWFPGPDPEAPVDPRSYGPGYVHYKRCVRLPAY